MTLLDSGADGADNNGEIKGHWVCPLMRMLEAQGLKFLGFEALDVLVSLRILGDACAALE